MARTLEELSDVELRGVAEDIGFEVGRKESRTDVIARIRERRRVINEVSREEFARILRWAGEEVKDFHAKDLLVRRFYRVNFRRTEGLSEDDLRIVARLHGLEFTDDTPPEEIAQKVEATAKRWTNVLKRASGRVVGYIAKKVAGADDDEMTPPEEEEKAVSASLRKGFKAALRFSMDDYIKEKLDEIEARIDRKLDELDRKMDDWRTREVRHRLRIIKYTIIATVVVAVISILYKLLSG
ncbi:MAG TPA: hypothetical protein VMZ92_00575 [Planctomycetota bacterium]|nr:hypothetical protein [Planctomycetota bacterium]